MKKPKINKQRMQALKQLGFDHEIAPKPKKPSSTNNDPYPTKAKNLGFNIG